ncbi:MAG: diguanylate cyclase [Acidobacteria bacterium]|nr:diguanylate cyclase [Acidobacteriota bacterium]
MIDTHYALLPLMGRVFLVLLFLYLYRLKHERYLPYWTVGWTVHALHYLADLHGLLFGRVEELFVGEASFFAACAALLFFDSTRVFSRERVGPLFTAVLAPVFLLWMILQLATETFLDRAPMELGTGLVALAAGVFFWSENQRREMVGGTLLAGAFFLWGLFVLGPAVGVPWGYLFPLDPLWLRNLPEELTALSMLIVLYEEERRAVERHMLGLAGLNLVTSTAQQAATVQDMLGQTLERVLGALRVPGGTIALALHGESQLACIHRGAGGFLRQLEHADLLRYLHQTVGRLGGLVVFPDLNQAAAPAAFAHEAAFERLGRLAREDGVRMLVGVSLRAKTNDRGVLLLVSPEARRFPPAELRLLLGLGSQIGLAVENYQLVQQAARRTEELRLLNEIGRALSSVLSVDELLERIHAEMQKVIDVSNFYIALYDPALEILTFELEVKDSLFLPKRRRRARNGLTEYILRHKQPLLIGDNFAEVVAQLGVEPGRSARSFCAVPILLHGEAVGVIGLVNYTEANAFDEQNVEVLTLLAAETAVAIENARLFGEEQRRSRHLALLNNVSRKAISTLNPEEMLASIAAEIHTSLPYDHIGLGVLDYAHREVILQAEAGRGAAVQTPRFRLGEGYVGQVAMSGHPIEIDNVGDQPNPAAIRTVLPDAASVVTLPVAYADQLLGVLNVESRKAHAFSEEDVLLLRTLADVVASALHNAFTYQKAQEQAITDGLTGVKTHRFFMEALTAEWRRATRANRSFSLMLIDLDKFKNVNDHFGHLEGDLVLQRVGAILEQNVRRSDVVARYGGDEFVTLMPETNSEQAYVLGDKLRQWLANDPLLREKRITGSVGIATYPQHASTPQELIQVADASMYLAKHQGGNMVVSADHYKISEQRQWQRNVLEAYLGVTIKRLFSTGPEAFEEVYHRLEQVVDSLGTPGQDWQEVPVPVLDTVTSLAFAIDAKDHYTQGHSQNVARHCVQVARRRNLPDKEVEEIRLAALLHDVGKIGVPERILNKPGLLDADEFTIMKEHPVLGAKILEPLRSLKRIQRIVRHHHEHWDGRGYPDGLVGEQTPLAARLIAIADAYDTMVSERTYKRALSRVEALEELRRCAGTQFDPELVETFIEAVGSEVAAEDQVPPVSRA